MEKKVKLMEKKFFAMKQNSQSVLCKFFNKCLLYMAYIHKILEKTAICEPTFIHFDYKVLKYV